MHRHIHPSNVRATGAQVSASAARDRAQNASSIASHVSRFGNSAFAAALHRSRPVGRGASDEPGTVVQRAFGTEIETTTGINQRVDVGDGNMRITSDYNDDSFVGELISEPVGILRGERSRRDEGEVWASMERAERNLEEKRGRRIGEAFPEGGSFIVEGGGKMAQIEERPGRAALAPQFTLGVSAFGLQDSLRTFLKRSAKGSDPFPHEATRQGLRFGEKMAKKFIAEADVDSPAAAREADSIAVGGYGALVYIHVAMWVAEARASNRMIKNYSLVLSRQPLSAVRSSLSGTALKFLVASSAQLTNELVSHLNQSHGKRLYARASLTENEMPGTAPEQRPFRENEAELQGEPKRPVADLVRQAWHGVEPDKKPISAKQMTTVKTEFQDLDENKADPGDASAPRSDLPLGLYEARYGEFVTHEKGGVRAVRLMAREWATDARSDDEKAWGRMADSRAGERGPAAVPEVPAAVAPPTPIGLIPGHAAHPVTVAFTSLAAEDAKVVEAKRPDLDRFARGVAADVESARQEGVRRIVVHVEGGGNGNLRPGARRHEGARKRGYERADLVQEQLKRMVEQAIRSDRSAPDDFPVTVESSSRGVGKSLMSGTSPRSAGGRRAVSVWAERIGGRDLGADRRVRAEVLAPFVSARLGRTLTASDTMPALTALAEEGVVVEDEAMSRLAERVTARLRGDAGSGARRQTAG